MMKTELLAPAGNASKLETALYFGADAVYVGGKAFSLRSLQTIFGGRIADSGGARARSRQKLYVAVNIFARNPDFGALSDYFSFLRESGADAAIVSDPGVIYAAKKSAPGLPLHLSTQANTTNKYAVKFWSEQGISRVILARELSLPEIAEIKDFVPETEIEVFVHGAMCISYSGRCLLSDYLDGRPSNRGACVQACRRSYRLQTFNSAGEEFSLPVEEDARGTYLLNSKDLNLFFRLSELEKAGVDSFKIEGRMKSEYYLATVINAYRRAMDGGNAEKLCGELDNVAHREYTEAFVCEKIRKRSATGTIRPKETALISPTYSVWKTGLPSCRCAIAFMRATSWKCFLREKISESLSRWKLCLTGRENGRRTQNLFWALIKSPVRTDWRKGTFFGAETDVAQDKQRGPW